MSDEKWRFLNNEILTLSVNAGLARGYRLYKPNVAEGKRKLEFKRLLRQELIRFRLLLKRRNWKH